MPDLIDKIGDFFSTLLGVENSQQVGKNFNAEMAAAVAPPPIPDLPPKAKKELSGVDALTAAEIREISLYVDAAFAYVLKEVSGALIAVTYGAATPYVASAAGVVTTAWSRFSQRDKAKIGIGDFS